MDLYALCNKYKWFTCGGSSSYEKLFELERDGVSINELAAVIYACSSNVTLEEIKGILNKEKR